MEFYAVLGIAGLVGIVATSSMLVEKGWDESRALMGGILLWWVAAPYALWFWFSGQYEKERAAKGVAEKASETPKP